eukprot:GHVR01121556.1.p1 GENE.GHVR01121556.1~~GHVR01121556.1.p1  ORF type:complete len:154 (+),score=30.95 GHVR01121556.1:133-594(+)
MTYTIRRKKMCSPEQFFSVVSNVSKYKNFLPWCKDSRVLSNINNNNIYNNNIFYAELSVGFGPLATRYTSRVTCVHSSSVSVEATDSKVFKKLKNIWRIEKGDQPHTALVHFTIDIGFHSPLEELLLSVAMRELSLTLFKAFEDRACSRSVCD